MRLLVCDKPSHAVSGSDMQVQVPVVLFIAEVRQHLAASTTLDDTSCGELSDLQQAGRNVGIQLQQGSNMPLRHHDQVLFPEPWDWRAESQHVLGFDDHIDVDQAGDDLVAVPVGLVHAQHLR